RLLASAQHQLREHADAGQRSLQFMRDIGNEVGLLLGKRELASCIRDDEPAAENNGAEHCDDEEGQRAAKSHGAFLQLLWAHEVKRRFPVWQCLADLTRDKRAFPFTVRLVRWCRGDGVSAIVEKCNDEFRYAFRI